MLVKIKKHGFLLHFDPVAGFVVLSNEVEDITL